MDNEPANARFFEAACTELGSQYAAIAQARSVSVKKLQALQTCVAGLEFSESTSLVVFGSLARLEWTQGSDIDWTLLVDGPSSLEHHKLTMEIQRRLAEQSFITPGDTGTFGGLVSSHELLHHIGGMQDTNLNLTRRLLLLLESVAVAGPLARELVVRSLLERYLSFGGGISDKHQSEMPVPRLLLNDFARLWRTIAVDYDTKKWLQGEKKWALRNAKLRFSRKLIFAKGLLLCFHGNMFPQAWPWNSTSHQAHEKSPSTHLALGIRHLIDTPAIDLMCHAALQLKQHTTLHALLKAYDCFLHLLNDNDKRQHLSSGVDFERAGDDIIFQEVRDLGRRFSVGLEKFFFDSDTLGPLTRKYGVF